MMRVKELKYKIESDWGIPFGFQKWIIGKKMAENDEEYLSNFDMEPDSLAFLYLVTPQIDSLRKKDSPQDKHDHDSSETSGSSKKENNNMASISSPKNSSSSSISQSKDFSTTTNNTTYQPKESKSSSDTNLKKPENNTSPESKNPAVKKMPKSAINTTERDQNSPIPAPRTKHSKSENKSTDNLNQTKLPTLTTTIPNADEKSGVKNRNLDITKSNSSNSMEPKKDSKQSPKSKKQTNVTQKPEESINSPPPLPPKSISNEKTTYLKTVLLLRRSEPIEDLKSISSSPTPKSESKKTIMVEKSSKDKRSPAAEIKQTCVNSKPTGQAEKIYPKLVALNSGIATPTMELNLTIVEAKDAIEQKNKEPVPMPRTRGAHASRHGSTNKNAAQKINNVDAKQTKGISLETELKSSNEINNNTKAKVENEPQKSSTKIKNVVTTVYTPVSNSNPKPFYLASGGSCVKNSQVLGEIKSERKISDEEVVIDISKGHSVLGANNCDPNKKVFLPNGDVKGEVKTQVVTNVFKDGKTKQAPLLGAVSKPHTKEVQQMFLKSIDENLTSSLNSEN